MVDNYKARKNEVLAAYDAMEAFLPELQNYAEEVDLPDPTESVVNLLADIRAKAKKVREDRFSIMIAGESKSGKSTFINAYLGVNLLPMDVKQCTSSIVEIKWGKTLMVRATYADGRTAEIREEAKARDFLKHNAALDDKYRDIPVPTINSEILVKSGQRALAKGAPISIQKAEVEAMLAAPEVQSANIHNLPESDYNKKIWDYIYARKATWKDIVTKIEIIFPFSDELRGVEIVDSPGVCARGGVSEITSDYIKDADAIIFLKPAVGQSLESVQFSQFMENVSVERNKNALFLVLTQITKITDNDLKRLKEEAFKQFGSKLDEQNILFVDSKAEAWAKQFAGVEHVETELAELKKKGELDDFVAAAYIETNGLFGDGDFVEKLHEKSGFEAIDKALDVFGRKSHYILLGSLLETINRLYDKLESDMIPRIAAYRQKMEDPTELAKKIAETKQELDILQNKLSRGVNDVVRRFRGKDGMIRKEAEDAKRDFLSSVGKIEPGSSTAFSRLEKLSLSKVDQFKDLTERLQHWAVAEFDKELVALSGKSSIPFQSLKPDFTDTTFQQIKDETQGQANETHSYEEGVTFKKTRYYSTYSQNKHFKIIKENILSRLDNIKNMLTNNLEDFVEKLRSEYIEELSRNAKAREKDLDAIMDKKASAEKIAEIIKNLEGFGERIVENRTKSEQIKGGIMKYVQ